MFIWFAKLKARTAGLTHDTIDRLSFMTDANFKHIAYKASSMLRSNRPS